MRGVKPLDIESLAWLKTTAGWIAAGVFGRFVWLGREIVAGKRKFWSPAMLMELPVAIGMGYLGTALANWMGTPELAIAFAGAGGYYGTYGLDLLLSRFVGKGK